MHVRRVPLYYTTTTYLEDDKLGYLFAWLSLTPVFMVVGVIGLAMAEGVPKKQRNKAMNIILGIVLNEIVNNVLKTFLAEPRPVGIRLCPLYSDF